MKTICRPSLVRGSKKKRTKRYNSDASISGPRDLYMLVLILFFYLRDIAGTGESLKFAKKLTEFSFLFLSSTLFLFSASSNL